VDTVGEGGSTFRPERLAANEAFVGLNILAEAVGVAWGAVGAARLLRSCIALAKLTEPPPLLPAPAAAFAILYNRPNIASKSLPPANALKLLLETSTVEAAAAEGVAADTGAAATAEGAADTGASVETEGAADTGAAATAEGAADTGASVETEGAADTGAAATAEGAADTGAAAAEAAASVGGAEAEAIVAESLMSFKKVTKM
jgi:hypothetical protein